MSSRLVLVCFVVVALAGCKKAKWIEGQWLLVTPEGKPKVCYEFTGGKGAKMEVYTGVECSGTTDPLLSGKWQLKEENKLAILLGNEEEAQLVLITEKDEKHFVASNGISGKLFRIGKEGAAKLVEKLTEEGVITMRPLPPAMGCSQLGRALSEIKALPGEPHPRMIRQKDQGLEYHADRATGDSTVEKVVYALNQEVIEWVAFHLNAAAYQPPGPEGRIEASLGKPEGTVGTGTGDKRQHIGMWRTYCKKLRGANNKDVDVSLFSTTGQQRGTIYVSENVVSGIWEELKKTIEESPPADEEEGEGEGEGAAGAPTPAPAPAPAPAPTPAPAAKKAAPAPQPPPAKQPASGEDDPI